MLHHGFPAYWQSLLLTTLLHLALLLPCCESKILYRCNAHMTDMMVTFSLMHAFCAAMIDGGSCPRTVLLMGTSPID